MTLTKFAVSSVFAIAFAIGVALMIDAAVDQILVAFDLAGLGQSVQP